MNMLQDCVIGRKKPPWTRHFWPTEINTSGAGTWTRVANPANASFTPCLKSSNSLATYWAIPYEAGDRLTSVMLEGYGDGAVDVTMSVVYAAAGMNASNPILGTSLVQNNLVAAWTPYTIPCGVQLLAAGSFLSLVLQPNAANFYFGIVNATFDRL